MNGCRKCSAEEEEPVEIAEKERAERGKNKTSMKESVKQEGGVKGSDEAGRPPPGWGTIMTSLAI